jgi:tetratricopeptide (TPR) repeat protein
VSDCRYSRQKIVDEIPLQRLVAKNINTRPVYVCCSGYSPRVPILRFLKENYKLVPQGLVYRVLPDRTCVDEKHLANELAEFWSRIPIEGVIASLESNDPFAMNLVQRYPVSATSAGRVCLSAGQVGNAEKLFTTALKLDAGLTEARHGLAICYVASGDYRRAAKELSTLLIDNPRDESLLRSLTAVKAAMRRQSTGNNT